MITAERRGLWAVESVLAQLDGEDGALASITASELLVGVHRADSPTRRRQRDAYVEAVLATIPVIPLDLPVARTLADLTTQLVGKGEFIGVYDLIIAATALTHDCSVLTENVLHFGQVPGLGVRQPKW